MREQRAVWGIWGARKVSCLRERVKIAEGLLTVWPGSHVHLILEKVKIENG